MNILPIICTHSITTQIYKNFPLACGYSITKFCPPPPEMDKLASTNYPGLTSPCTSDTLNTNDRAKSNLTVSTPHRVVSLQYLPPMFQTQVTTKSSTRAKSNGQTTLVELTLHYHCSCLAICSWSIDLLVNLHTQKARKSVKNSLTEIKKFQKHNTRQKHIHRWLKNHRVKCITLGVCDDNRTLTTHTQIYAKTWPATRLLPNNVNNQRLKC